MWPQGQGARSTHLSSGDKGVTFLQSSCQHKAQWRLQALFHVRDAGLIICSLVLIVFRFEKVAWLGSSHLSRQTLVGELGEVPGGMGGPPALGIEKGADSLPCPE